jgi:hypothetical protein
MDSPVEFSMKIQQVCLAEEWSNLTGQNVTSSGWGLIRRDGQMVKSKPLNIITI